MVCETLGVTDVTTTTAPVMATSILLWAFISSLARLRRVEEASPGDPEAVLGTDSHWRDSWPNIALRSVPHA